MSAAPGEARLCACPGEEHEPACPLFAAGVIEFFLRSFVEYWPCAICGRHRGMSVQVFCRDCRERAKATNDVVAFIVLMAGPRRPLPRTKRWSFRVNKRMERKAKLYAVRQVVTFLRAMK